MHIIKDNMFDLPILFEIIQKESATEWKEMYKVFNMGHRMEMYIPENIANGIIEICNSFSIEAKIIGKVEESAVKKLTIDSDMGHFQY